MAKSVLTGFQSDEIQAPNQRGIQKAELHADPQPVHLLYFYRIELNIYGEPYESELANRFRKVFVAELQSSENRCRNKYPIAGCSQTYH